MRYTMFNKTISVRANTRSVRYSIGAIAAILLCSTQPGDLITISASCSYASPNQAPESTTAYCQVVVRSPLGLDKPIYVANGWRTERGSDGKWQTKWSGQLANGMLVRAYVWDNGKTKLTDGIQLSDGRVWVDGKAYDRAFSPVQSP